MDEESSLESAIYPHYKKNSVETIVDCYNSYNFD
jgi:hypothetical protein